MYVTAITAAGGNGAVMASYFHVALSGPARTWLMNLTPGTIQSWEELCARFTANFASAYQQHGVEAHLHAVRQKPGETLRAFISRFTKVRGTIPRISDASIITAFRQGVRDEKMLEKLATHEVESVTTLFSLAHSPPRRRCQGWRLRCYRSGRWQEEEEQEPESRGTAIWRTSHCSSSASSGAGSGSSGWGPECTWQTPSPARWKRRFMPSASHRSPQRR